jgi:hypothetical protein
MAELSGKRTASATVAGTGKHLHGSSHRAAGRLGLQLAGSRLAARIDGWRVLGARCDGYRLDRFDGR